LNFVQASSIVVQVRRIGRKIEELGSAGPNLFLDADNSVCTEVVQHHHIARLQFRAQHLLLIPRLEL
jgi:hypothetical protein